MQINKQYKNKEQFIKSRIFSLELLTLVLNSIGGESLKSLSTQINHHIF